MTTWAPDSGAHLRRSLLQSGSQTAVKIKQTIVSSWRRELVFSLKYRPETSSCTSLKLFIAPCDASALWVIRILFLKHDFVPYMELFFLWLDDSPVLMGVHPRFLTSSPDFLHNRFQHPQNIFPWNQIYFTELFFLGRTLSLENTQSGTETSLFSPSVCVCVCVCVCVRVCVCIGRDVITTSGWRCSLCWHEIICCVVFIIAALYFFLGM